jgi:hypothetical protein
MAHSFALRADPVANGSTIVQASTLLNEASCFASLPSDDLDKVVGKNRAKFFLLPNPTEYSKWMFYRRSDMTSTNAVYRTIIGIKCTPIEEVFERTDPTTGRPVSFKSTRWIVEARSWYFVSGTWTAGDIYDIVAYAAAADTVLTDPETRLLAIPTNGYTAVHEVLGFLFKPVAAGVPLSTPIMTALGYGNPNAA